MRRKWSHSSALALLLLLGIPKIGSAAEDTAVSAAKIAAGEGLERVRSLAPELAKFERRVDDCRKLIDEAATAVAQKFAQYVRLRGDFDAEIGVATQILAEKASSIPGAPRPSALLGPEIKGVLDLLNVQVTFELSAADKAATEEWVRSGKPRDQSASRADEKVRFVRWWLDACQHTLERFRAVRVTGPEADLRDFNKDQNGIVFPSILGGFLVDSITSDQYDGALSTLSKAIGQ